MRYQAKQKGFKLDNGMSFTFYFSMPKSWGKKKRKGMLFTPHTQRPDIDNLLKGVLDSLCEDDSWVWHIERVVKFWVKEGKIEVN